LAGAGCGNAPRSAPFLFQRANFIAKTNYFGYYLLVFVFAIVGANFPEAGVWRNSSP